MGDVSKFLMQTNLLNLARLRFTNDGRVSAAINSESPNRLNPN